MDEIQMNDQQVDTYKITADLQEMQNHLCIANHVYATCYGVTYQKLTQFSGSADEEAFIRHNITVEMEKSLIASFNTESIENVIAGETHQEFVLMKAVGIRGSKGEILGVFVLTGVAKELLYETDQIPRGIRLTTEEDFDHATALIEQLSKHFFHERLRVFSLEDRLEETKQVGRNLEAMLCKNEVMTETLKMLESENDFTKVAEDILQETGNYFHTSVSFLLRLNPDNETMDLICEWSDQPKHSMMSQMVMIQRSEIPFLNDRPYTISSETVLPENFKFFFQKYHITAGVFLPLMINEKVGMYLCYIMIEEKRHWTIPELKFMDDIKRVLQTILVKRVTKNSLASSYAALDAILENAGCGICVHEKKKSDILYSNGTFQKMFEHQIDRQDIEETLSDISSTATEIKEYYANQTKRYYTISFANIRWVDGREVRMSTIYDITGTKNYQKQIEEQANTDYLTGLYNRMRFEKDFNAQIREAVRSGEVGNFLYIDMDDFMEINDGLGHHIGDALLKEAGNALKVICREIAYCYRLGGDEFAVLVPAHSHDALSSLIKTIQTRFEQPWELDGNSYYCTMCMGVVSYPKDGVSSETLLQRADIALCVAKQKGKDLVEYYNQTTPTSSVLRLDMEKAMREAVEHGCHEFNIYYQPVMNVRDNKRECCGAEALVRWTSPQLGFVMPGEFIPLAEYLGLIVPIGEHVLMEACKRCKYWNDFGYPEYKINVNLSVVQLLQNNIVDTIRNVLMFTNINPSNLTLEVTEGLAVNDMENMNQILMKIKELGVRLALDDFGTGYSSLSHLRTMPLDVVKIDKVFINDVGEDVFSDAFVKSVSDLAESMNLNVVVEGVEHEHQALALSEMNIDMIQGYLFDKPLTQEDFESKYLDL